MILSWPIYRLKRQARILSRREGIPHHEALDRVAREQGFDSWSLLATRASDRRPGKHLKTELKRGDLVLIGARPGQGKTLLSLELAVEAMKAGQRSVFFSLECSKADVVKYFAAIGEDADRYTDRFDFDDSDDICATYIISSLESAPPGTVAIIDYLQLLDQKRKHAELMNQVELLKACAEERGLIMLFISQVHRRFDPTHRPLPTLDDIRLPNPLDLTLFNKACFLHDGVMEVEVLG